MKYTPILTDKHKGVINIISCIIISLVSATIIGIVYIPNKLLALIPPTILILIGAFVAFDILKQDI